MAVTATEVERVWGPFPVDRAPHAPGDRTTEFVPSQRLVGRYVHRMIVWAPDSTELEGGHPVELGELDGRAGPVYIRAVSNAGPNRALRPWRPRPRWVRHVEEDRLTGDALADPVEQLLRRARRCARRGGPDLVAIPAPPAHAEAAQLAVVQCGERLLRQADPPGEEAGPRPPGRAGRRGRATARTGRSVRRRPTGPPAPCPLTDVAIRELEPGAAVVVLLASAPRRGPPAAR